ncbi:hypothetical protein DVH24_015579 [Malus domestica]|uniref:Uncharacterized protein n=1 Tax=Malus domestica TaxID=3750 RepID=A0A498HNH1_MALDO|nr:hypothetical protein DVH24_015579 [Malus domestica]
MRGQTMLHIDLHDIKSCYSLKTPLDIIMDEPINLGSKETRICWRRCSMNTCSLPLFTLSGSLWNLKSLDGKGLEHLTSSTARNCRVQESRILAKRGIENCPSLTKRYEEKQGKDWRNIARFPCIKIDGEVIIII